MTRVLLPPSNYTKRKLDTITIEKNTPLYRCYSPQWDPIYFGLDDCNRFNDANNQVGVMYIGKSVEAALTETLLHGRMELDFITVEKLNQLSMVEIVFDHDIQLVNFNASGLKKNNVDSSIFSGEHFISRKWASAIINNVHNYNGIYYPCKHDNQYYSIALFDRDSISFSVADLGSLYGTVLNDFVDDFLFDHGVGVI